MSKLHKLKTWPEYYKATCTGEKLFEVRKNDRGFEVYDTLLLMEYDPIQKKYTGKVKAFKVTFILQGEFGYT